MSMTEEAALEQDNETFRTEVRAWLAENCPPSMRTPCTNKEEETWGGRKPVFFSEDARLWFERMVAKSWIVPDWPTKYGGAGLSREHAQILTQELRAIGARNPLSSLGIWLLAPVVLECGTEDQKLEHLPPLSRGEIRWCQGYSEPGAGSDLASLQTKAELDGDEFIVNGQKIWTSHANKADFMFCLVRTDFQASKHQGISFLLIDMASPGISTRPIRLISGSSPFCETFFENVRVPKRNLVGEMNRGWDIAKRVLQFERALISRSRDSALREEEPLSSMAKRCVGEQDGRIADPVLRDAITQAGLDSLCNQLTLQRSHQTIQAGKGPGPETSMFKLYGTELNQRRKELKISIEGVRALGWEDPEHFSHEELALTSDWLRSRANSIEGGSSEIQRNIIAKRVLGLPD
jgi:acyl-CoA dehydrogenase